MYVVVDERIVLPSRYGSGRSGLTISSRSDLAA